MRLQGPDEDKYILPHGGLVDTRWVAMQYVLPGEINKYQQRRFSKQKETRKQESACACFSGSATPSPLALAWTAALSPTFRWHAVLYTDLQSVILWAHGFQMFSTDSPRFTKCFQNGMVFGLFCKFRGGMGRLRLARCMALLVAVHRSREDHRGSLRKSESDCVGRIFWGTCFGAYCNVWISMVIWCHFMVEKVRNMIYNWYIWWNT